jgi:hypothetical protein
MVAQLATYLVLFLPLYNSFQTFQFIITFAFEERDFVLKSQVALNKLEPNSTNIMCSSIIDKYINRTNQYESLSLVEFSYFYNIKKKISKHHKPKIIRYVNYNKYKDIQIGPKNKFLLYSPFQNLENSQLETNVT